MKFIKYDLSNVAVIGDIHASVDNLTNVLKLINVETRNKIVSVGDVWDRGVNPNETIDILHDLYKANKLLPIVGNHDNKFIRYFGDDKRVVLSSQQEETLKLVSSTSIEKFVEIFESEIVCIYDPFLKVFISHAPGGRPRRILEKNYENSVISIGGQRPITFEDFLLTESHSVAKKHISTLLYGITNGDKTVEGFPVRLPIIKDESDDLDGWTYIYGHIHASNFHPELNSRCICLDFCSPTGPIGACVIDKDTRTLFV
jgi:predicted phosphodiesterase